MIMPRGQQLLLPANPWFIFLSLLSAQLLNMVLNMLLVGNAAWAPDTKQVTSNPCAETFRDWIIRKTCIM